jgi:hypothetical protein
MGCERLSGDGFDIFICANAKPRDPCTVPGCTGGAVIACQFELQGRKLGQRCGRRLCESCAQIVYGSLYCEAHARLVRSVTGEDSEN